MTKRPWMPLYVNDFQIDTLDLTAEETGIYMILLMLMWRRNGSLPNDMKWLKRSLQASVAEFHGHTFNRIIPKLLGRYFVLEDGVYTNKRLTKELQKADKISAKQSENVNKRWAKVKENKELSDTNVIPSQHNHSHNTEGSKKDTRPAVAPRVTNGALPVDWQPSMKAYAMAEQHGQNVQIVEEIFRDYLASSGKRYLDYDAAFHNFIRNQQSFNRGGSTNGRAKSPLIQAADDLCERLAGKIAEFDGPPRHSEQLRGGAGENVTWLLPNRRGQ